MPEDISPEIIKTYKNRARLTPKLQRLRAAKIVERKVLGNLDNKQLAQEFNVVPKTIKRALALAEKAEIVVKFEDKLYNELLPKSHEAVAAALEGHGDVARAKIGLAVMQGTQVLRPTQARTQIQQMEDDELAMYVMKKRKEAQLEANTVEGEAYEQGVEASIEASQPQGLLPSPRSPETDKEITAGDGASSPESPETEGFSGES